MAEISSNVRIHYGEASRCFDNMRNIYMEIGIIVIDEKINENAKHKLISEIMLKSKCPITSSNYVYPESINSLLTKILKDTYSNTPVMFCPVRHVNGKMVGINMNGERQGLDK